MRGCLWVGVVIVGVDVWLTQGNGGGMAQVEYAELTRVLRVHVHGARRLRLGKSGVAPNPYIKVGGYPLCRCGTLLRWWGGPGRFAAIPVAGCDQDDQAQEPCA